MDIRRIRESDIDHFLKLWDSVYAEGEFIVKKSPSKERVQKMVSKVVPLELPNFVAWDADKLVGAAEVFPASFFNLEVSDPDKHGILGILIRKSHRGIGLAQQLMDKLIEGSIHYGFNKIELDVFKSNIRAIKLYNTYNFRWVSDGDEVTLPSGIQTKSQKMVLELHGMPQ